MFAEFHAFPTAHDLFGGAFDPKHAGWAAPVPDTWTHHLPAGAPSGPYYLNVKGRRTYMGQDIPSSRTLELQVGSPQHTQPHFDTGGCASCHSGPSALDKVNHANANMATCAGCHLPLGFELEGPIYVAYALHPRAVAQVRCAARSMRVVPPDARKRPAHEQVRVSVVPHVLVVACESREGALTGATRDEATSVPSFGNTATSSQNRWNSWRTASVLSWCSDHRRSAASISRCARVSTTIENGGRVTIWNDA